MAVVGSLTLRGVRRQTLPDGRRLPPTETTEYIQADRKREEHRGFFGYRLHSHRRDMYRPGPQTALIKRCDLKTVFLVNFDDREYTAWPIEEFPTRDEIRARAEAVAQPPAPTVLVETETIDTGERREFFGRPARHVITTRRVVPLPGSRRQESRTVTDAWYIDLDTGLSCDPWGSARSGHAFLSSHMQGDQPDRPTFKNIGEPERGYVVLSRSTSGAAVLDELEVTHFSTVAIDPAIFAVPTHFSRVERIRQEPVPPLVIRLKQAYERLKHRARMRPE